MTRTLYVNQSMYLCRIRHCSAIASVNNSVYHGYKIQNVGCVPSLHHLTFDITDKIDFECVLSVSFLAQFRIIAIGENLILNMLA